jgi:hypothetical protein
MSEITCTYGCIFRLHGDSLSVVADHRENGNVYEDSFYGDDMVTWLRENSNKKKSREDLEEECRELLEFDIVKHGKRSNKFHSLVLLTPQQINLFAY